MEDFLQFISRSPTVFHAAREITRKLAGFTELKEADRWQLQPGQGYYVVRDGSLVAAFRMPRKEADSATILASHIDSPCLKLKPHPLEVRHEISQYITEVYGAPQLYTWLDRDLCVAGRVVSKNGTSELVHWDDHPVIIPSLAIHLDRNVTERGLTVHKQDHLKPIVGLKKSALAQKIGSAASFDLFLCPLEKPALVGADKELIASYRLDNLTSAYAALQALLHARISSTKLQMAIFWDHEEVGSTSYVGADSSFASQLLERIGPESREDLYRLKSQSLCISGDLAHGFHPNFADKYDLQNAPFLGKGVVLKSSANQRYATSAPIAASILRTAEEKKIPIQQFANRSDIPSGSTVGSMMAATLGMPTVDVGIAGLAMHSIRETIAAADEQALIDLFTAALED